VTWSKRAVHYMTGVLVIVALFAGFFTIVGGLSLLNRSTCNRLNQERLSHLEPGHIHPGPASIYVKGVGPGPPASELDQYYEAEAAMERAGCPWTGRPGPGD
jgi:hypothetical protein